MRVYDTLMRSNPTKEYAREFRDLVRGAIVIEASNVAMFVVGQRIGPSELIRCVPPFEKCFVEFKDGQVRGLCHGVLTTTVRTPENGWNVQMTICTRVLDVASLKTGIAGPHSEVDVSLDAHGNASPALKYGVSPDVNPDQSEEQHKAVVLMMHRAVFVVLATWRFMAARNVRVVEQQAPRHERRQAMHRGEPAPVTYRTLEIAPLTRALKSEGRIDEVGLAKALHICRGHFADYTQGAGLFGKYHTEVFVPEHFRGRRQRGEIVKDYVVSPPTENVGNEDAA